MIWFFIWLAGIPVTIFVISCNPDTDGVDVFWGSIFWPIGWTVAICFGLPRILGRAVARKAEERRRKRKSSAK